jgi:hypothetical protein
MKRLLIYTATTTALLAWAAGLSFYALMIF